MSDDSEVITVTDPADNPLPADLIRKVVSAAASMLNVQSQNEGDAMLVDAFWAWPAEVRMWLVDEARDAIVEKTEQLRLKDESITAQLAAAKGEVAQFATDLTAVRESADALTLRRVVSLSDSVETPVAITEPDAAVVGSIAPAPDA